MFIMTRINGDMIGITDTDDSVEEFYSRDVVRKILVDYKIRVFGAKIVNNELLVKIVEREKSAVELAKRLLIDSIWKSAGVEGLDITFSETKAIVEGADISGI